jgi:predicted nucleic acid-binding protein
LEKVSDLGAVVPSLWRLEVANVLTISMRRGRCDAGFVERSLTRLSQMMITVDDATDAQAWHTTLRLAWEHGLTIYDASYLELALRRNLPIATCDKALARAAQSSGIEVI